EDAELLLEGQIRQHLAVLGLHDVAMGQPPLRHADRRDAPEVGLARALEVHFVVQLCHRLLRRVAALERERANPRVDGLTPTAACRRERDRNHSRQREKQSHGDVLQAVWPALRRDGGSIVAGSRRPHWTLGVRSRWVENEETGAPFTRALGYRSA